MFTVGSKVSLYQFFKQMGSSMENLHGFISTNMAQTHIAFNHEYGEK